MPEDVKKFAEELFAGAGLPDEQVQQIMSTLTGNPVVAERLGAGVKRHSTFASELDKTRNEAFQTGRQKAVEEYSSWRDEQQRKIDEFWAQNGNPQNTTPTGNPEYRRTETGNIVSAAEIQRLIKEATEPLQNMVIQQGETLLSVTEDAVTISDDYRERFGKRLPIAQVRELAVKERIPLSKAYEAFIRPELEERAKSELENKVKEAYDKGLMEGQTRAQNPTASGIEGHPIFGRRLNQEAGAGAGQPPVSGIDAFEAEWNKSNGFTKR